MFSMVTLNELYLRAKDLDGRNTLYVKTGSMVGFSGNCRFSKVILGPNGDKNPLQAAAGQVLRRMTGENLPLMSLSCNVGDESFYASDGRHVMVLQLQAGERIMVESEDLLAFSDACKYSSRALAQGIISEKGFFDSFLSLFAALCCGMTYFKMGGVQLQINYLSADELIKAQQEPEKYRNLRARVTGFSGFFTGFDKNLQDEIINRSLHSN